MTRLILAWAAFALACPALARGQTDPRFVEMTFHRVHLRNGNVVDGQLLRQTPKEVVLKITSGEISFRMDSVDFVEFVKMKSFNDRMITIEKPKATAPPPPTDTDPPKRSSAAPNTTITLDPETSQTVKDQLEAYGRGDVEQKATILNKLIALGGQVPAYLASIVNTFDRDQVPVILNALVATKNASLVGGIVPHLESPDPNLRLNAAMALGALGETGALPYLIPVLKDTDPPVRTAAVTALALLKSPDAFDPLLPILSDKDRETRTRAISTLNDLAVQHGRKRELGEALAAALASSHGDAQVDLIYALGHGGHQSSWNALAGLLREESGDVRRAAAAALTELAVPDSAPALQVAVATEHTLSIQIVLAKAVQQLHILGAGGGLIDWLEQGNRDLKLAARSALASLAGSDFADDIAAWRVWWDKAQPK